MNKYKVCVYAICKDEEKFVDRWMDSMSEADSIVVLDTGSNDNTVSKLKLRGAIVDSKVIFPWRFDVARNKSMEMIPDDTDICVCTDLDEVFEPNWRQYLEDSWNENIHRLRYRYTWSFNPNGTEGVVFFIDKIHKHKSFKWTHPVHEVLTYLGDESYNTNTASKIQLNHYPDNNKSRRQYFELLELAVKEDPNDDRNVHYLGREYLYNNMYDKCIETLKIHLSMESSSWADERAASARYISKSYLGKGNIYESTIWIYKAIAEAPYLREPYIDAASLFYQDSNWHGVIFMVNNALNITERSMSYINEPSAWGDLPYDLLSISYYNIGLYELALQCIETAIQITPTNQRFIDNFNLIQETLNQQI